MAPQRSPVTELSADLLAVAFAFLGPDILTAPHVCRRWRAVTLLEREDLDRAAGEAQKRCGPSRSPGAGPTHVVALQGKSNRVPWGTQPLSLPLPVPPPPE